MVIDPNNINNSNGVKSKTSTISRPAPDKSNADKAVAKSTASGADSVSLSSAAQSMSKLEIAIAEVPEINASRVAEIRDALQSGQYRIDANSIASKMLAQDI